MTVIDLDGSPAAPEPRRPPSRPRLALGALGRARAESIEKACVHQWTRSLTGRGR
jgi:hypothetical protein